MPAVDLTGTGNRMYALMEALFPLCRSITGSGTRKTLQTIAGRIPLEVHEVPSGTQALDWTVPAEWNIRDAYIAQPGGARVVDFQESNLHIVGYSEPIQAVMPLAELRAHLHALPEHPDWVPYRTSYYSRTWGFCLAQRALDALEDSDYEVFIDSTLEAGSLTYGECVLSGESEDEVLLTTHVCPNDNLSGIALLTELAEALARSSHRLTYRFLFIPGTIGSVTWLARNEERLERIVAGLVVACVGDPAPLSYKRSRRGDTLVDRAAAHVISRTAGARVLDFVPWGWDERQFNSPGFDLPVGCLSRSREGEYEQYHSSADDLSLVRPEQLEETLRAVLEILDVLETDKRYVNLAPKGEPQLGKRGLYSSTGGGAVRDEQLAMLWVLNQSDGINSLLDIAERSEMPFARIRESARRLTDAGLLVDADSGAR
ncbi:MAG: peptidase [Thermoleophilia bacterium]|nr:peptidase [Thermoleophilia bacterium]